MVNQLAKFILNLSDVNKPSTTSFGKKLQGHGEGIQKTFNRIKEMLCSPEVLAHYNPNLLIIVAADAVAEGIGAVLLQQQKSGER